MNDAKARTIEQHGLRWEEDGFDFVAVWTVEPDTAVIASLSAQHLASELHDIQPRVAFLAGGGFNKVFTVTTNDDAPELIFRVSLPVDPCNKTESEVATLKYVKEHTTVPVPDVIAYDSSADNALGFEWILMSKVIGITLEDAWDSMSQAAKESLTTDLARMVMSLQTRSFGMMGSLYQTHDKPHSEETTNADLKTLHPHTRLATVAPMNTAIANVATPVGATPGPEDPDTALGKSLFEEDIGTFLPLNVPKYTVGRIVDLDFVREKRIFLTADRGPYLSSQAFMDASVDIQIARMGHLSNEAIREDLAELDKNMEDTFERKGGIEKAVSTCRRLREYVPETFGNTADSRPSTKDSIEIGTVLDNPVDLDTHFVLVHPDMSARNIILDPVTHKITGIIDWEFSTTKPLWQAIVYPDFLHSSDCEEEDLLETDREDDLALERRDDFELTQLRKVYNTAMQQAGLLTPESMKRSKRVRRQWRFCEILGGIDERGVGAVEHFLQRGHEETWVTHHRGGMGLYLPDE